MQKKVEGNKYVHCIPIFYLPLKYCTMQLKNILRTLLDSIRPKNNAQPQLKIGRSYNYYINERIPQYFTAETAF